MTAIAQHRRVVARAFLAVVGGYAVSAGVSMLVAVVLPIATGVLRSEAVVLASMMAFPLYLGLMILAFADGRPFRLYLVFTVVAAMSWGGALGLGQIVEVH